MESMRERNDNFEMPNIPNVAIPGLRDGGLTNGVNGVTMRENGGRVKRGSIKRQSEILREKKKSRQEEREEERKRKESYFRKVTGMSLILGILNINCCLGRRVFELLVIYFLYLHETSSSINLCIYAIYFLRSEESQSSIDGVFVWWILKMLPNCAVLRFRRSACWSRIF